MISKEEFKEIVKTLKNDFKDKNREEVILILKNKKGLVFKKIKNISESSIIHLEGEHKEYFNILRNTQFLSNKPKYILIGIAHNHPFYSEKPSETDLKNWFYDVVYFIYSNKLNKFGIYNKKGKKWKF